MFASTSVRPSRYLALSLYIHRTKKLLSNLDVRVLALVRTRTRLELLQCMSGEEPQRTDDGRQFCSLIPLYYRFLGVGAPDPDPL